MNLLGSFNMKKKKNLNRRDAIKTITFATPALAMQEFQTLKKISNTEQS